MQYSLLQYKLQMGLCLVNNLMVALNQCSEDLFAVMNFLKLGKYNREEILFEPYSNPLLNFTCVAHFFVPYFYSAFNSQYKIHLQLRRSISCFG